jgi:hypothetical protein
MKINREEQKETKKPEKLSRSSFPRSSWLFFREVVHVVTDDALKQLNAPGSDE